MFLLRGIVVWVVFIFAESLNGAVRIFWLMPTLGEVWAERISFVIGSVLILTIATLLVHWMQIPQRSQQFSIGILWLLLTLGFEIALGRFAFGYSWSQIAADYDLRQGGLMPIGLAWLIFAPFIAEKLQKVLPHPPNLP
jgi:hypothetical protein